jgi:hypothetical protein
VITGVTVKDDQEGSYSPLTTMLPLWARGAALAGAQKDNSIPASQTKAVIRDKITIRKKVRKVTCPNQLPKISFLASPSGEITPIERRVDSSSRQGSSSGRQSGCVPEG